MQLDQILLWTLTVANSFAILLVIRQLAQLPAYRGASGPRPGADFAGWTLQTLDGNARSDAEMPPEYTMLFTSETCGPCHELLKALAKSGRTSGKLVVAADGDGSKIKQSALTPLGYVYDEILLGADQAFRQRFQVPGTPFAIAIRRRRVVAAGLARTPEEVRKIANTLQSGPALAPVRG